MLEWPTVKRQEKIVRAHNGGLLSTVCLTALLFPFFSPAPIDTDVQLFPFLVAIFAVVLNNLKIKVVDLKLFIPIGVFAMFSLLYVDFEVSYLFTRRLGVAAVFVICIFFISSIPRTSPLLVLFIMITHVLIMIFQWVEPEVFKATLGAYIRAITYSPNLDERGVHGLNAEPGGAAAVIFGCFVLHQFLIRSYAPRERRQAVLLSLSLCWLGLALTRSGIAVLLFFATVSYLVLEYRLKKLLIFGIGSLPLLWAVTDVQDFQLLGRGVALFGGLLHKGVDALILDGSFAERLIGIFYGVYSLLLNPFGLGGGGYPSAAQQVENIYSLSDQFLSARSQIHDTVSVIGLYLAEFGLFFIVFLVLIFWQTRPKSNSYFIFQVVGFIFLLASYSFAFPVTWLILMICYLERRN
jgi:hypothetical protein